MSWLTDNSEAQALEADFTAARTRPQPPEKTGLVKAAGLGFMRGGVDLARGTALAASTLFPHETAPDDGSRIVPRKEDFFKFIETKLDQAEKYWTPDPESVGLAGQIIGGISGLPLQLTGGPGLMAVSAGLNAGEKLVEQGVDATTASVAAVGAGTVNALMMKLPQAGNTLLKTAGATTLMPLLGAGQDLALKRGLESQGYTEQAAAIDPLNPVSRLTDLTLGGVFGAMGYHANRVTARAEATAFENVSKRAEEYTNLIKQAGGENAIREQLPVETVDSLDTVRSYLKTLETNPFNKEVLAGVDNHLAMLKSAIANVTEGKPVDVTEQAAAVLKPDPKPLELQGLMDKWSARYGLTPEEEAGVSSLIQARAKVLGVAPDEFVSKHFADVTNEQPGPGALMQDRPVVPPFYSKLLKEVDALPQEKWNPNDLLNKIRKTEGVKADEIAWTGLDEFLKGKQSVTRAEVRDYLDQNQVQVREVTKGGQGFASLANLNKFRQEMAQKYGTEYSYEWPQEASAELSRLQQLADNPPEITKYSGYVTPGGENYRELLLTLPGGEYKGGHFDEKGILAHIRFNERPGPNGEAILHVEEVQSDWHQARRDGKSVPDAPFTKTWHELALRRMLRYAAENGFDRLTWTTGEQQAERYDISKKMESVSYRKDGADFIVSGVDLHGGEHALGTFTEKQLPDAVGKELSQKITNGEGKPDGQFTKLAGLDLKVGGQGMKGFYDKMLPQFMDKFGRKFGAKVEDVALPEAGPVHSLPITEAMRESLLYEGQPLFQGGKGAVSFLNDGRAVIHALESPDFSTASHELAHVFERTLTTGEKYQFDRWLFNSSRGKGEWSITEKETFARAFENYLAKGEAPTPELQGIFDKFKTWLVDIYRNIIGSPLEARLHPDAKKAFDSLLVSESMRQDVAPEVQAVRAAGVEHAAEMEADLHELAGMEVPEKLTPPNPPLTNGGNEAKPTPARILRDLALHTYDDPELIKRFVAEPTNIAGALAQALENEATQLRGAKSNNSGPSLVELMRKQGINDDRGDLAAMEIDKGLKPGSKKMLRPDGLALDKSLELAVEKGYLPEGSTTRDLLDKVDQELRGTPVYPNTGETSSAPEWFQSILNLNRRTGKKGDPTAQAIEALQRTAAGEFAKLTAAQQDMVLAALDHINHGIHSSAVEIDAHELQVGDRYMSTDLAYHTVVAARNGQLVMNDGLTVATDSLLQVIGEVDQTGRPPEKGYDALDYQVESLLTERGGFTISNGKDAAGNEITVSAREYIDAAKNEQAAAENRKHLYDRAAACMGLEF